MTTGQKEWGGKRQTKVVKFVGSVFRREKRDLPRFVKEA